MFLKVYIALLVGVLLALPSTSSHASQEEMLSSPETDCVVVGAMLHVHPKAVQTIVSNSRMLHGDKADDMIVEAKKFFTSHLLQQDVRMRKPILFTLWDVLECEVLTDPMEKL